MTVKFVKDPTSIPVFVNGFGYAYPAFRNGKKFTKYASVTIRPTEGEAFTIEAKDVPDLIKALEAAAAYANEQADKSEKSLIAED